MGPNGSGALSDDQGPLLNMVSMTQYAIAVLFVALRFITRGIIVKKFGLDDFFIAIAVALGAAQTVTIVLGVEHGRGRHAMTLQEEQFNAMLMVRLTPKTCDDAQMLTWTVYMDQHARVFCSKLVRS